MTFLSFRSVYRFLPLSCLMLATKRFDQLLNRNNFKRINWNVISSCQFPQTIWCCCFLFPYYRKREKGICRYSLISFNAAAVFSNVGDQFTNDSFEMKQLYSILYTVIASSLSCFSSRRCYEPEMNQVDHISCFKA